MTEPDTTAAVPASHWQALPAALQDDETFLDALEAMYQEFYGRYFAADPMANHALGIEFRALRRVENWRLLLVLTPWLLTRLLVPDEDPGLPVPPEWAATRLTDADYQVLGPRLSFEWLGTAQQAHLAYDRRLGHYLQQPLVLNMQGYADAEAVFAAWDDVIRKRDANMAAFQKECPWQREVSRRELLTQALRAQD